MSDNQNGIYTGYLDLLAFYQRKSKECPKGVTLKLERHKFLLLQFTFPGTGKRVTRGCNVTFTEKGIIEAIDKAWKVKDALQRFTISSEFWNWYDLEILNKNEIKNDLKTYREIFNEIENEYWNGTHKNTGEKRDRNNPSNQKSFKRYYQTVFDKFNNLDNYPNWEDFEKVLYSWEQGTGQFENAYCVLKSIAQRCNSISEKSIIEKLKKIDPKQNVFKEKQSISINEFLDWHKAKYDEIPILSRQCDREAREQWLWIAAMCAVYGLRPSEIMSAINLFNPVTEKEIKQAWGNKGKNLSNSKITIKAINDLSNTDLLLVLGNQYYIGENKDIPITIKTGGRICTPLCNNKQIIELLKIQCPLLPIYTPKRDSKLESLPNGIPNQFREKLLSYNCPVTQAYAFRHLGNQLGEKYGIPQEIRARSLGHSVAMNDSTYKSRVNLQTTVDLLTNYSKQPLSYDLAVSQLKSLGVDVDDINVKLILKVVYQLG